MAVPCPGCGREYDVALFAFGRTLHCTCGTRVGLEPRVRSGGSSRRLAADAMLGRLARWLRVIGCDTSFDSHIADAALVQHALAEGRWILTRDRALMDEWRLPRVLVVRSERPAEQLREVVERLDLDWRQKLFTRCNRCNRELGPLSRDEVRGRVPERIRLEQEAFLCCSGCQRIYWEGSHVARMRRALERALA